MNFNMHWGNVSVTRSEMFKINHTVTKNISKLQRLIKYLDPTSVNLTITLAYDEKRKTYKVTAHFVTPRGNFHVAEMGFGIEETIKKSVHTLRRKFRKDKEKRITLNRKKS